MTSNVRILLASSSARRQDVLRTLGVPFDVIAPEVEETADFGSPELTVGENCRRKAEWVRSTHPGRHAIAADTIVTIDAEVLGKPIDRGQALRMLERLSGREHRVLTDAAYIAPGRPVHRVLTVSHVRFRSLTTVQIQRYFACVDPLDKAGAYDIASHGELLVQSYCGSRTSVMGLCAETTQNWLKTINTC